MDLDTYRQDSRETWAKMAPGWEDRREWLMGITGPVNAWLADAADPQPGQVFLDIAAGTGDLGLLVAERVGDQGRVVSTDFAVWGTPDRNPWAAVPGMTLMQRGHLPPPEPGAPGIFALGEPERILDLVGEAGFAQPELLEELAVEFRWADFDDLWDTLIRITGPLSRVITALPDDEREATRNALEENVAQFRNEDGTYSAPGASWGVLTR